MKKIPYAFLIGLDIILVFYLSVGFVAAGIILDAVSGQTHNDAGFFDSWWQILIFVIDILLIALLVLLFIFRAKTKKSTKKEVIEGAK